MGYISMNANKLLELATRVQEELDKQHIYAMDANVNIDYGINGWSINLTPHEWSYNEQIGAHKDDEPKPVKIE